jgi:PRC-barrel domain
MLQVISPLKGFAIEASDGRIGTVVDYLFDDASWKVRWLVIDCGTWLTGRKVLIHPSAISREDLEQQKFVVALTKAQVEGSPELLEDQPVSQQMENLLYTYYGWDPLWGGPNLGAIPGAMASPLMAPPYLGLGPTDEAEAGGDGATLRGADPHLRSVVEVTGYRVHAVDGEIGHIENLMIDDADWSVHYLIVDTRNWWFGKRVLISPLAVKAIDWFDRHVELKVSRELVKASPPWDPLVAFNEEYAKRLHKHYGWPGSRA